MKTALWKQQSLLEMLLTLCKPAILAGCPAAQAVLRQTRNHVSQQVAASARGECLSDKNAHFPSSNHIVGDFQDLLPNDQATCLSSLPACPPEGGGGTVLAPPVRVHCVITRISHYHENTRQAGLQIKVAAKYLSPTDLEACIKKTSQRKVVTPCLVYGVVSS